jgi:transposase, IS5 family
MFCGILLLPGEQIKDKDMAGRWRSYLGEHLDMDKLQMDCVSHWKSYMEHTHRGFSDATVYESYIEYPTDAKLLWKSCCDVLQMIRTARKSVKLRDTRINHEKRKKQYLSFAKRRKKSKRHSKKMCKMLLKYLQHLTDQLEQIKEKYVVSISASGYNRLVTIKKLKEQQWQMYFGNQPKVPNRIVSLHKPYVRPIIR